MTKKKKQEKWGQRGKSLWFVFLGKSKKILQLKKNDEILPFATTWMDLEGIMLSEIIQTEKDKYCMVSFIYGIYKYKTNQ